MNLNLDYDVTNTRNCSLLLLCNEIWKIIIDFLRYQENSHPENSHPSNSPLENFHPENSHPKNSHLEYSHPWKGLQKIPRKINVSLSLAERKLAEKNECNLSKQTGEVTHASIYLTNYRRSFIFSSYLI